MFSIVAALAWAGFIAGASSGRFPRAPWNDIATYLRANTTEGDAIVHDNKLTFFPMHVVDPSLAQVYLPDVAGIGSDTLARPTQEALGLIATDVDTAIAGQNRAWLVIFARARSDYRTAGFQDDPNWLALDAAFEVGSRQVFGDVEVVLWLKDK